MAGVIQVAAVMVVVVAAAMTRPGRLVGAVATFAPVAPFTAHCLETAVVSSDIGLMAKKTGGMDWMLPLPRLHK